MFKDKIIIWTPDEPSGYGVLDQDYEDELQEEIEKLEEDEKKDLS